MERQNSGIFKVSEGTTRGYFDAWAVTLTTEQLERELIANLKDLFTRANDRVLLCVQALNAEYERRGCTLFPERISPLPFEGASTLLAYAGQCVRDWEMANKGRLTIAPDELDQLGAWHFENAGKLPKARA